MKKINFALATALGFLFVQGCSTSNNSNQPWDRPIQEDNRPGYKSPDAMPLNRDAK